MFRIFSCTYFPFLYLGRLSFQILFPFYKLVVCCLLTFKSLIYISHTISSSDIFWKDFTSSLCLEYFPTFVTVVNECSLVFSAHDSTLGLTFAK
jgi:hypothetical protein